MVSEVFSEYYICNFNDAVAVEGTLLTKQIG